MKPNLKSVKKLCQDNPDSCREGGVRWHIFNEGINGLAESGAIIRVGRKVLVDEDRYFNWMVSQDTRNAA